MSWKLKFRFGNPYLVLKTPLSPAPNLHDYAHWIRPAIQPSYQPKKVWNRPTWVRTSFKAQWAGGGVKSVKSCIADRKITCWMFWNQKWIDHVIMKETRYVSTCSRTYKCLNHGCEILWGSKHPEILYRNSGAMAWIVHNNDPMAPDTKTRSKFNL